MRFLKIGIITVLVLLWGCSLDNSAEDVFALEGDEIQLYYFETQCNDPWYGIEGNSYQDSSELRISQMIYFLEQMQIEVLAASYSFDEQAALACLACNCQTGGVFFVKVQNDEEILQALYELGFLN